MYIHNSDICGRFYYEMASSEWFEVKVASQLTQDEIKECAELFSSHYGVWGRNGRKPGEAVKMGATQLRSQYLFDDRCFAVMAHHGTSLIGHALYRRFEYLDGYGVWVTQLVVHKDYRRRHVASKLLAIAINDAPKLRVAGLASSHPAAVLALERVMKSRCIPALCSALAPGVLACCGVPYLSSANHASLSNGKPVSIINTRFFVDHGEVDSIRESITGWKLGKLNDGEEFFVLLFTGMPT